MYREATNQFDLKSKRFFSKVITIRKNLLSKIFHQNHKIIIICLWEHFLAEAPRKSIVHDVMPFRNESDYNIIVQEATRGTYHQG